MSQDNNQLILKELETIRFQLEQLQHSKISGVLDELQQVKSVNQELLKEIKLLRENLINTIGVGVLIGSICTAVFGGIFVACVSSF